MYGANAPIPLFPTSIAMMKPQETRNALFSVKTLFLESFNQMLISPKMRITAARPGTVNFDLSIGREHTVCLTLSFSPQSVLAICTAYKTSAEESSRLTSWGDYCKHG